RFTARPGSRRTRSFACSSTAGPASTWPTNAARHRSPSPTRCAPEARRPRAGPRPAICCGRFSDPEAEPTPLVQGTRGTLTGDELKGARYMTKANRAVVGGTALLALVVAGTAGPRGQSQGGTVPVNSKSISGVVMNKASQSPEAG